MNGFVDQLLKRREVAYDPQWGEHGVTTSGCRLAIAFEILWGVQK
jgi:hypothetical protein